MLVVADSSPLIVLVNIAHIDVLPKLFGHIVIPPAVDRELLNNRRPELVRNYFSNKPAWLTVQSPVNARPIPQLHQGEIEALSLAIELKADLLLVDERKAYQQAIARKINSIGTVRVLERAAIEVLLDLHSAFEKLKQTDFWISHDLLDTTLKLHRQHKQP